MSIDITSETVVTVTEVAKRLPGRPSARTIWRWLDHGCRGNVLESVLVGGRRYTSTEAVQRFLNAINAPDAQRVAPTATAKRQREIQRAERELKEAGI